MTLWIWDKQGELTRVYHVREVVLVSDGSIAVWVIGDTEPLRYPAPMTYTIRLDGEYS